MVDLTFGAHRFVQRHLDVAGGHVDEGEEAGGGLVASLSSRARRGAQGRDASSRVAGGRQLEESRHGHHGEVRYGRLMYTVCSWRLAVRIQGCCDDVISSMIHALCLYDMSVLETICVLTLRLINFALLTHLQREWMSITCPN